ncbi:hypothetical protein KsCSTR_31470 [Candidatus Kuenenia stuttgartiensis]|jgi:hypothetical protein|uniref:Uncharacterized protein n=1 Tax=Kuenenia stuttgartiensis TaxID=174633 RepID=A0A2C9CAU9_KUEST|nr:hypothetical protein KsCSTR_31470 [Candidatus Kuenenia stuttgartiensis]SOH02826.1 hypothetical protein KSMBR1_0310 [Candidatus Kuenenia stuttgartiensis]
MINVKKCIGYSLVVLLPLLVNNKIMASETEKACF